VKLITLCWGPKAICTVIGGAAICRGIGKQRAFGVGVSRFILRDGEAMHLRWKEPFPG
jgi:hypothetical protein